MSLISVIVPVYKVEPYLHRCVDSILAQTFTDFELILVDDGSPDNCGAICDEYAQKDNRIHVIHQENGGLSAARNAGIDWVFANNSSEWISFIDSDDWIHPRMIESLYDAVCEHDVKVGVCGFESTDGAVSQTEDREFSSRLWETEAFFVERYINAVIAWGKLYHRDCYQTIRYPLRRLHEDVFITHQILFKYEHVAVIEEKLYKYFINNSGISKSAWSIKRMDEYDGWEAQCTYFAEHGFEMAKKAAIYRYLSEYEDRLELLKRDKARYREEIRVLKRRKKKTFPKYIRSLSVENDADAWILTRLMPIRMHIYWYCRALCNKIRRLFSR